jgi:hypothetical protein
MRQVGWIEKASADNATATATHAAPTDDSKQHVITSVSASFATTRAKLLQLKDGTTVIWEGYVYDKDHITFPEGGVGITVGAACSAVLAASGSGLGKVNLTGITI